MPILRGGLLILYFTVIPEFADANIRDLAGFAMISADEFENHRGRGPGSGAGMTGKCEQILPLILGLPREG